MKNDVSKKVQVPYRLPETWVMTLRELPNVVGFSQQQIIEDALAALFGERDPMLEGRVNMVRQAIKKKKVCSPFDTTTPPQWSNSAPIMLPDSMTLCTT